MKQPKKQYLVGNTSKAIKLFNAYLNQFSAGSHTLKAHFYLAQLYDGKDLENKCNSSLQICCRENEFRIQRTSTCLDYQKFISMINNGIMLDHY